MAKRLTDTDIWDKEWFMKLSPKLKCLTKFIRDKCDLAGVWNPNWVLANLYIGEKCSEQELLSIDNGNQFHKLESGKIFCIDFITFQNGTLSDKSPIHIKILSLLNQHGIQYPYPINRVCNTPIVVVEVKSNSISSVNSSSIGSEKIDELIYPFDSLNFKRSWDILIAEKEWRKKSQSALQASLKKLSKYDEQTAIEMINDCIAGGWKGLVEPKKNYNNSNNGNKGETKTDGVKRLGELANAIVQDTTNNYGI